MQMSGVRSLFSSRHSLFLACCATDLILLLFVNCFVLNLLRSHDSCCDGQQQKVETTRVACITYRYDVHHSTTSANTDAFMYADILSYLIVCILSWLFNIFPLKNVQGIFGYAIATGVGLLVAKLLPLLRCL